MPYKDPADHRRYLRERYRKRRADYFADKRCAQCGSKSSLRLHHRDPATKVSSTIWCWAPARREAELAKCIVLCESCHVTHHTAERLSPCGTESAYNRSCRCTPCREAHAAYRRERRARGLRS